MTLHRVAELIRDFLDTLTRSPRVKALEAQLAALDGSAIREISSLRERIRDKEAQIFDLRIRLSIAEGDAMRERLESAKRAEAQRKPVPEFEGRLPYQDELAAMSKEKEQVPEGDANGAPSK